MKLLRSSLCLLRLAVPSLISHGALASSQLGARVIGLQPPVNVVLSQVGSGRTLATSNGVKVDPDCNLVVLPDGMVFGENLRPAFASTKSACLELFFRIVPGLDVQDLHKLLPEAWKEDAECALRIIFQTGNVRHDGGGKQDRQNFYRAILWLYLQHPSTFFLNAEHISKHTCLKCLLDILMFVTHPTHERYSLEGSINAKENLRTDRVFGTEARTARWERQQRIRDAFAISLGYTQYSELQMPRTSPLCSDDIRAKDKASQDLEKMGSSDPDPKDISAYERDECQDLQETLSSGFAKSTTWASPDIAAKWADFIKARETMRGERAKAKRRADQAEIDRDVRHRLQHPGQDSGPKRLFDVVVHVFATGLAEELDQVSNGVKSLGGLYAKWAPTPNGMHDKATRISEAIAKCLYEMGRLGTLPTNMTPEDARECLVRRYARDVLSPLREAAKVPEHFVGKAAWTEVDYNRMASRCRLLFGKKVFWKHDKERYEAYLEECKQAVLQRKAAKGRSVKTGALLPHEVVERSWKADDMPSKTEVNLQWRGLVESCIASWTDQSLRMVPVCDVSGSMRGVPMDVAIALSLLLCESAPSNSPWHGKIFTFSQTPRLVAVPGIPQYAQGARVTHDADAAAGDQQQAESANLGDLLSRVRFVQDLDWGMNTNLDAVFDLLLEKLIQTKAPPEDVRRLAVVIFSDMEFDCATSDAGISWETAQQSIAKKFEAAGYGPTPPLIVYWNLRDSLSIPAVKDEPGVVLLSGFSAGMMRAFLQGRLEDMTPRRQLEAILSRDMYTSLRVADEDL